MSQPFDANLNSNFICISVSTLRGDQKINFNVYIRVNDNLILYLQKGDSFEGPRLDRLREKGLKQAYIKKDDALRYYDYVHTNYSQAYEEQSKLPIERRIEIIQGDQQAKADALMRDPTNQVAYMDLKASCTQFVNFVMKNTSFSPLLLNFYNPHFDLAQHGVNVAAMSLELARNFGYQDSKLMSQLAMGAMVHDIGHFSDEFPYPLSLDKLTADERAQFIEHPKKGAVLGQDKIHFDQPVINIIMQHEECIDGSGYPQGFTDKNMDPTTIFVASANAMDRLVSFENLSREKAAKKFMVDQLGKFPLENLKFLSEFVKKATSAK